MGEGEKGGERGVRRKIWRNTHDHMGKKERERERMTFEEYWHSCSWKKKYSKCEGVEMRGIMRTKGIKRGSRWEEVGRNGKVGREE